MNGYIQIFLSNCYHVNATNLIGDSSGNTFVPLANKSLYKPDLRRHMASLIYSELIMLIIVFTSFRCGWFMDY